MLNISTGALAAPLLQRDCFVRHRGWPYASEYRAAFQWQLHALRHMHNFTLRGKEKKEKLHHVNKKLGTGNEKLEHGLSWGLLYDLGAGRD